MSSLVVTGTDTGIGKTVFCAALTTALGARYWKPIQSGLGEPTDSQVVSDLGVPSSMVLPELYKLKTPVSPHLSARIDGVEIDIEALEVPNIGGPLVVEGAGGLLVPVTDDVLYADIFARWRRPTVLCARTELGTINHTLLSIEAMRTRAIPIAGVAFIGTHSEDTEATICRFGRVVRLGRLPTVEPMTPRDLDQAFLQNFDVSYFRRLLDD